MKINGIKKRWLFNSLSLAIVILFSLGIIFALIVRTYLYNTIENSISDYVENYTTIQHGNNEEQFINNTYNYISEFYDKNINVIAFDNKNNIISSSGNINLKNHNFFEFAGDFSTHVEILLSGEKILTRTVNVYDLDQNYLGNIKYIASIDDANNKVFLFVLLFMVISIIVIAFIATSNICFIKSILEPVAEISLTAKKIAQGDFNAKIGKVYDDEIGELCNTINYMADELSIAEKLKNDFISSLSHELRTPLTAIKGWAETMQLSETMDKGTMDKGMRIIVSEAERLSGIVEELLDFSRMQSGRMVIMMDKMDILAELDEAVYMFKEKAISENKKLIYQGSRQVSPILGDKNRIKQVFINIIDNAIKYTPENGTITINIYEEKQKVVISVTDTGYGIAEEHLPKVKDKFYKANYLIKGSGIGLAVADEIIKLHSGNLDISSCEGLGTTVTISIPIIKNYQDNNNL